MHKVVFPIWRRVYIFNPIFPLQGDNGSKPFGKKYERRGREGRICHEKKKEIKGKWKKKCDIDTSSGEITVQYVTGAERKQNTYNFFCEGRRPNSKYM